MIETILNHYQNILIALFETTYIVFVSMFFCFLISLPLGTILFGLREELLFKNKMFYHILNIFLNSIRAIPFLILIFILIPVTRFIFKTSFGNIAAIFPITLVSISIYSRLIEQSLINVPKKIILRAISMGANRFQIIYYFLLPTIKSDLVLSFTTTSISALAYSTVIGVIGGKGLGEYAYRYGYQEYQYDLLYLIVLIFIIYVFIIQNIGYFLAKRKG